MRKKVMIGILAIFVLGGLLTGCGGNKEEQAVQEESQQIAEKEKKDYDSVDVDLTLLSSTMVYSEVYNMLDTPDDYIGKTVRMKGMYVSYTNEDETQYYPAVIIADATACCSQGLEFVLSGEPKYPDAYPKEETEVTVVGTFETYDEEGTIFCHLVDAALE